VKSSARQTAKLSASTFGSIYAKTLSLRFALATLQSIFLLSIQAFWSPQEKDFPAAPTLSAPIPGFAPRKSPKALRVVSSSINAFQFRIGFQLAC
jgi:hypothetical protein